MMKKNNIVTISLFLALFLSLIFSGCSKNTSKVLDTSNTSTNTASSVNASSNSSGNTGNDLSSNPKDNTSGVATNGDNIAREQGYLANQRDYNIPAPISVPTEINGGWDATFTTVEKPSDVEENGIEIWSASDTKGKIGFRGEFGDYTFDGKCIAFDFIRVDNEELEQTIEVKGKFMLGKDSSGNLTLDGDYDWIFSNNAIIAPETSTYRVHAVKDPNY